MLTDFWYVGLINRAQHGNEEKQSAYKTDIIHSVKQFVRYGKNILNDAKDELTILKLAC